MKTQGTRPLLLLFGSPPRRRETLQAGLGATIDVRAAGPDDDLRERPTAVCVELGDDPSAGLAALARIHAALPDVPSVAIAGATDSDLILRAMRAGAREFLLSSDEGALVRRLQELLGRRLRMGVLVSCHGVRGGVGTSTLAVNLAAALATGGARVALVDLDLHLGHIPMLLDLDCAFGLSDLIENLGRLDGELLLASLTRHGSGLYAIAQVGRIEEAETITATGVGQALALLKRHFDFVVVDGVRGIDERAMQLVELADHVVLPVTPDMLAVRNAQICVGVLRRVGCDERKLKLVVNRVAHKGAALEPEAIAELLRLPIAARVTNDFAAASRAAETGRLIAEAAPRSRLMQDVARLTLAITGEGQPKRAGLLGKLFGRAKEGEHGAQRPV